MGSSSVLAALMASSKSNRTPTHHREGDGKVDEEVGLEVALISPPGHEDIHQRFLWSGVDFTDVTLVYKDANQYKAHKIILS